jgi:Concanavalin A-like lectin/glucanases superfamily
MTRFLAMLRPVAGPAIIFFITILLGLLPFSTPLRASGLTDNIVAYWKMDENMGTTCADATGNGHTADFVSSPGWTTGKINYGVSLAPNSYLNAGSFPTITVPFSVSFWADGASQSSKTLVQSSNYADFLVFTSGGTKIVIYAGSSYQPYASFSLDGTWHHFVVVIDADTTPHLYIDGSPQTLSGSWSGSPQINTNFRIGGTFQYYTGDVDEVGIWSRALSSTEISQLYNSGAGLQYPFAPAVPARKMRLFEGFKIKLISGKIILFQQ